MFNPDAVTSMAPSVEGVLSKDINTNLPESLIQKKDVREALEALREATTNARYLEKATNKYASAREGFSPVRDVTGKLYGANENVQVRRAALEKVLGDNFRVIKGYGGFGIRNSDKPTDNYYIQINDHEIIVSRLAEPVVEEIRPEGLIGLDLVGCVYDIVKGAVQEKEVKKIITKTSATTPEELEEVIYKNKYSTSEIRNELPKKMIEIAHRLLAAGKIEQLSSEGKEALDLRKSRWIDVDGADDELAKRMSNP